MKSKKILKYGLVILVTMFAVILQSFAQMNTVYFEGQRWEYSIDKVWDDNEGMYVLNIVILATSSQDQWFLNFPSIYDLNIEIDEWYHWDDELGEYVIRASYEGDEVIVRYKISDALYKYESSYYWSNSSGGYVNACDVTDIGAEAFMNYAVIEHFYAEGLCTIGNSAFEGCINLAHPEHFAYNLECIGERAFYGCSSLTNFVVGRHLSEISSSAFLNCQNIESFDVHPSNITYRCENGCLIRSSDNTLIAVAGKMSFVQIPEGVVAIGPYAFSENTNVVSVITPTSLTNICDYAFYGCTKLDNIQLNEGLIDIGYQSFYDCKELSNIEFPNTLISIQSHAFEGCEKIRSVSFPPSMKNLGGYSFRGCKRLIKYNVPVGLKIEDGTFDGCGVFLVDVISTAMRQSDPTIMDIVYRVSFKTNECVSVRMLAYKNGERSLYNVIRPETFVDGTEKNIGEGIPVNQDIKVSWKVSADWSETLSEINVEVMAERKNRYSWRYMIIPSKDSGKKIKVYMNSIGPLQTYDALLWLYASKDPDIKIENGNLYGNGQLLASGKYLKVINSGWEAGNVDYKRHDSSAAVFVLPKLGFKVLSADELSHFSTLTRIPSSKELSDSTDSRPYYDYYAWTRLYMPYVYCGEYVEE